MNEPSSDFARLASEIREFAVARDWERFHTPKNLAMAVAGEAGELVAEFQWLSADESVSTALDESQMAAIAMEIADVQIYLIRLADVLGIDIVQSVLKKMGINQQRF